MAEGRIDDEMIEISDPTEEPVTAEPPPKVVIEYRERGVPWMLIPPLLILSAVGAVVGYHKLVKDSAPPSAVSIAATPALNPVEEEAELKQLLETEVKRIGPAQLPADTESKPAEAPPVVVEVPADPVALPAAAATPPPAPPTVQPAEPVDPMPAPEAAAKATFPKVTGLGFDPKALEAERKAEAPPADPALTPAAREDQPKVAIPDNRDQPTGPDEDILPPDPRGARVRQKERVAEAIKQVELDRIRFHNDLRELCRIARPDYIMEVITLSNKYGMQLDPNARKEAVRRLGDTGRYAGADRRTRVEILREIGYPETLVLEDIFEHYEKIRIGERNGPRNPSEAMYRSILSLLRYAPGQKATARAASPRPPQPALPAPPSPAFSVNPGTR